MHRITNKHLNGEFVKQLKSNATLGFKLLCKFTIHVNKKKKDITVQIHMVHEGAHS